MTAGTVKLKMKYLGDGYIGQDLCWYKISVGVNAVSVERYRAGQIKSWRFYDQPDEVSTIKAKLRGFVARMSGSSRVRVHRGAPGTAIISSYYPSESWGGNTGTVHWMGEGSI